MAILHSRAGSSGTFQTPTGPVLDRARAEMDERLAAARAAGAEEARRAFAAERSELEQRARSAEERARREIAEMAARMQPAVEALEGVSTRLAELESETLRASEGEVVRLGMAVAAAILRREIAGDGAWMQAMLGEVLAGLPDRLHLRLRLHPLDAEVVRQRASDFGLPQGVEVLDDPSLPRGGIVVRSGGTERDAGVPSAWERVHRYLSERAPRSLSEGLEVDLAPVADQPDASSASDDRAGGEA